VKILVTNDDGINAEGLLALTRVMSDLGEVYVAAPDRQRSAVGLCITLEHPLRVNQIDERVFSIDGMPADCVTLAIHQLMESPPDLIISGINEGQNLGYDIYHSGTVGAAIVGTMFGIRSMAVSIADKKFGDSQDKIWYNTAANVALKLAKMVLKNKLPDGTLLNINVPNVPESGIKGIKITKHCNATYSIEVHNRVDPRGKKYYWVGGEFHGEGNSSETDLDALKRNMVSVTPLRIDLTHYEVMDKLATMIKM
jgi:5'-nucleotidase